MGWFKYLTIGIEVATEIFKASLDGKITLDELLVIATKIAGDLGIKVNIPVTGVKD